MKGERGGLIMPFFAKVTARTPAALRQQQLVPPPAAPPRWPLSLVPLLAKGGQAPFPPKRSPRTGAEEEKYSF